LSEEYAALPVGQEVIVEGRLVGEACGRLTKLDVRRLYPRKPAT